jgi:hypothetical protein
MICGEHGCPVEQCEEFTHAADTADVYRAYVKEGAPKSDPAKNIWFWCWVGQPDGVSTTLLRFIRERL